MGIRSFVYYSASFIPGQFNPDSWNVPTGMFEQYGTVKVFVQTIPWETDGDLFHRNTMFDPLVSREDNLVLAENLQATTLSPLSSNFFDLKLNEIGQPIILNTLLVDPYGFKLNDNVEKGTTFNPLSVKETDFKLQGQCSNYLVNGLNFGETVIKLKDSITESGSFFTVSTVSDNFNLASHCSFDLSNVFEEFELTDTNIVKSLSVQAIEEKDLEVFESKAKSRAEQFYVVHLSTQTLSKFLN